MMRIYSSKSQHARRDPVNLLLLKREFILTARNVIDILRSEADGTFVPTAWKDKRQARYYMRTQSTA